MIKQNQQHIDPISKYYVSNLSLSVLQQSSIVSIYFILKGESRHVHMI